MVDLGQTPIVGLCVAAVAAAIAGLILLGVHSARRDRERYQAFLAYAFQQGWLVLDRRAAVPPGVVQAARSRRSKLLMVRQRPGSQLWLSWHRWQETSTSSSYNSTTGMHDRRSTTTTHNLTRYFLTLAGDHPAMSVRPRTKLGGFLKGRRGMGTGDDTFDRAFLIKPMDSPAAVRELTAAMRRALLARAVPPWSIADGMLITEYSDAPDQQNLAERTAAVERVASLLPEPKWR